MAESTGLLPFFALHADYLEVPLMTDVQSRRYLDAFAQKQQRSDGASGDTSSVFACSCKMLAVRFVLAVMVRLRASRSSFFRPAFRIWSTGLLSQFFSVEQAYILVYCSISRKRGGFLRITHEFRIGMIAALSDLAALAVLAPPKARRPRHFLGAQRARGVCAGANTDLRHYSAVGLQSSASSRL